MLDQHVIVTLVPLIDSANPTRSLILNPAENQVTVAIGRCSKREIRKRTPEKDNAWYDSRVMSRDHSFITINSGRRIAHIRDNGSTHGTFLNDDKLITGLDTPLCDGDILRFGVNVDRGHDNFQAVEVKCKIYWPKREIVVIPDDVPAETSTDVAAAPSKNTFAAPDDDEEDEDSYAEESCHESDEVSEAEDDDYIVDEHVDNPSDDSRGSASRSWESIVLQPADVSSVSSVDQHEVNEKEQDVEAKHEQRPPSVVIDLTPADQSCNDTTDATEPSVPEPVEPETHIEAPSDVNTFSNTHSNSSDHNDKFPETCYQKVPEDAFSDWTMMKPMFMRLADMAWGESDHIPDVDFEKKIIHAARRCSLSRDSYWVDDHASFKPRVGTEVIWTPDSDESDSSFHRVPGQSLKYWSVDKRRYWVIQEDKEDQEMSNWWWIVEKPWDMLSTEIQTQLTTESHIDDRYKCWIVRAWEPQMIGETWWESPPYWDSCFGQDLCSEDESIDSAEHECESDLDEDSVSNEVTQTHVFSEHPLSGLLDDQYNTHEYFDSEEDSDASEDSESVEGSLDVHSHGWKFDDHSSIDEDVSYSGSSSDSSGSDSSSGNSSDDEINSTTPQNYIVPEHAEPTFIYEANMAEAGPSSFRDHAPNEATKLSGFPLADQTPVIDATSLTYASDICASHGMTHPSAQFPEPTMSWRYCRFSRDNRNNLFDPAVLPTPRPYQEGPFSVDTDFCKVADKALPSSSILAGSTKRTASDMESSSALPEDSFSQDAQLVPVDPYSQPGLETASPEVREAIASALAENTSAVAENDRPAKRTKSTHTPSKSLASHVTTAFVGALLGGLATVATLAALPNEYFA
ncbi:uncharacterized protein N7506_004384 [Penicillium brevicompactum]|uniref:uncharacterized protein n=1 Tax=Penicillium brevicompactum TaxID=5074 RepID=UPI002542154D|nr:uncharacterized protein N7506_004384 [Penicillium brevicompactum]KAJ5336362.1 hypothetical protein N7506_004384 [Penicillium brevicompactum]